MKHLALSAILAVSCFAGCKRKQTDQPPPSANAKTMASAGEAPPAPPAPATAAPAAAPLPAVAPAAATAPAAAGAVLTATALQQEQAAAGSQDQQSALIAKYAKVRMTGKLTSQSDGEGAHHMWLTSDGDNTLFCSLAPGADTLAAANAKHEGDEVAVTCALYSVGDGTIELHDCVL